MKDLKSYFIMGHTFINQLPDNVIPPEVCITKKDGVEIDWCDRRSCQLSITIEDGKVIYAFLGKNKRFGPRERKAHGQFELTQDIPKEIMAILLKYFTE